MDKTININLGGSLFLIDEDAFRMLRDYLQAINSRFRNVQGSAETIEDIESRIAEIFNSQKGLAGTVTKENVEAMIAIIGKPGDFEINEPETGAPAYPKERRRLYRSQDDRIISGVCGGLGAYLETDPVLFRILFVIFTLAFGIGLFGYAVLWISLPSANTEARKRELYGSIYHHATAMPLQNDSTLRPGSSSVSTGYRGNSRLANVFNEVFRAIGRVLFLCVRIILIIIGVSLVLTGFLAILSFVMVFVFKYPGTFTHEGINFNPGYIPEFLNYIVKPSLTPWIIGLSTLAFLLPMLAIIYWGVKMIFWFRARDGIYNLAGFVLWVLTVAALAIILFNEGVSFAKSASTSAETLMPKSIDTLYVMTGHKVADLKFDRELMIPDGNYNVFLANSTGKIYIRPDLQLKVSDNNLCKIEIDKRSFGRTESDAIKKSESLLYNYRISRDTLYLDDYFTLQSGSRWSADWVTIYLTLPRKTILFFDTSVQDLFHKRIEITRVNHEVTSSKVYYGTQPWELKNKYWVISENGLRESGKPPSKYR